MVTELNSIHRESRFQKDRRLKDAMLKVLSRHQNGIYAEDFISEVGSMVKVSRGTIYRAINEFLSYALMREETDPKDRRRKKYYPVVEKVKAQTLRFRIEDFIHSLRDVQCFEYEKVVGDYDLTVSFLFQHYRKVELPPEIKQMLPQLKTMLEPFMETTKVDALAIFVGCRKHSEKV